MNCTENYALSHSNRERLENADLDTLHALMWKCREDKLPYKGGLWAEIEKVAYRKYVMQNYEITHVHKLNRNTVYTPQSEESI